jgi:hypothetical protein
MNQQQNNQEGQNKQIQIKASDEKMKGEYSNLMQMTHTNEEFVLDFLNVFPPTGTLNSRVIVSPGHFKRMISAMKENLKKYEEKFGEIPVSESPASADKKIGFQERS